jgi:hypothetical protein
MLISVWSAKGGVGTTVVAAALAVCLARREPGGILLIDLAGDLPTVLGSPEPAGPALADWLASGGEVPTDALGRLEHPVGPGLGLIHRGAGPLRHERGPLLARLLAAEPRTVVADCGVVEPTAGLDDRADDAPDGAHPPSRVLAAAAPTSLLVTRPCFLAMRRASALDLRPTGVVLVVEDGRAITAADIESVVGAAVVARVRLSPAVARAVDAGLLASAMPRGLEREVGRAA